MGLGSSVASNFLIDSVTGYNSGTIGLAAALMIGMQLGNIAMKSMASRVGSAINIRVQNGIQAESCKQKSRPEMEKSRKICETENVYKGNTAQIAYRESHSKLVCRAASIIPSVRLAGRINSGCQAGPVSQDQVRQSEQHIQFSGLLPQAPVPCLSVSEPTLDHRKYVFHFRANR